MAKSTAGLVIRNADVQDAEVLSAFRCSTGPWYEQAVEDYINRRALSQQLSTPSTYSLLLALEEDRLVGCMAHHPEALMREDSSLFLAVRLQLLAIAVGDQGRRLKDGKRLSDALMQTLIRDACEKHAQVLTTIVAQDNLRSMAMCERNGLRSQIRYNRDHVRLTGHFTLA